MSLTEAEYKRYRRSQIAELADWHEGFDMAGVSISDADKAAGSPKLGDKIARNPANHADRWLVAADYFAANFESCDLALTQIRAQGQKPVAWKVKWKSGRVELVQNIDALQEEIEQGKAFAEVQPLYAAPTVPQGMVLGFVKPDNDRQVFFYEQDHYYLSNFSAFTLDWEGLIFPTSEQAYHWERFKGTDNALQEMVRTARSAHEAFRLAQDKKAFQRSNWDSIKVGIMRDILIAKACQHEYVLRKLLQTGDKELIEDSWRDDFWGWGPNRDGQNMLGKLWMEVRAMLAAAQGGKNG